MPIYDSVNGVARKVTKIYDGVEGVARKVNKVYDGVDNVARLIYTGGVSWGKYSCTVIEGEYEESYTSEISQSEYYSYGASYDIYTGCGFDPERGFYDTDSFTYQFSKDDTLSSVQSVLVGSYLMIYSNCAAYITGVDDLTHGDSGLSTTLQITQYWAEQQPTTYHKGSTSYGTVSVSEGELPEEGTLIEGSIEEGYCVLQVESTYYYYILEV